MTYSNIISLAERYDRQVVKLGDRASAQMDAAVLQGYEALIDAIIDGWGDIVANKSIIPQQQRVLLADQLGDLLNVIHPERRAEYEALMQSAIEAGEQLGAQFADRVNASLQPGAKVGDMLKATTGVPVEALANQVAEGVNRLYRHGEENARKISAIVEQGLIQNWGRRKITEEIEATAKLMRWHANMIARTEVSSAFNGAAIARALEADCFVQWIALGDDRCCPSCAYRQMKVYRANEIHLPLHPLCRCVAAPLKKEWLLDMGVITDEDLEFMVTYRAETLEMLKATGKKPRAAGPFDLPGGPPKAVWVPKLERSNF